MKWYAIIPSRSNFEIVKQMFKKTGHPAHTKENTMQAIQVKILGPTTHNGLRIKAWSNRHTQYTEARDYSIGPEAQAKRVVAGFCEKSRGSARSTSGLPIQGSAPCLTAIG